MLTIFGWKKIKPKTEEEKEKEEKREKEARFHKLVNKCAKKEKDREINCLAGKNAVYVLKILFRYAQNEVYIFTYGLDEAIFSNKDLILEAIKFLTNPEARLKIVYKDPNLEGDVLNTEFVRSILIPSTKGKVEIWNASKSTLINHNDSYFWLNDRYGSASGPKDVVRSTIANFGNRYGSGIKTIIFNDVITKSDKVL